MVYGRCLAMCQVDCYGCSFLNNQHPFVTVVVGNRVSWGPQPVLSAAEEDSSRGSMQSAT